VLYHFDCERVIQGPRHRRVGKPFKSVGSLRLRQLSSLLARHLDDGVSQDLEHPLAPKLGGHGVHHRSQNPSLNFSSEQDGKGGQRRCHGQIVDEASARALFVKFIPAECQPG
jgi:hypothetical protein